MPTLGFKRLRVYQLAYSLALEIFQETKHFPQAELFDLTDQLRRSSRAVARNIAEAWRRRVYAKAFRLRLIDSSAEASETEVSLDMAFDCGYLSAEKHEHYIQGYDEVHQMLSGMLAHPEKFVTTLKSSNIRSTD